MKEEILGLFRKLEFRTNRKSMGQVVKKPSFDGSKFERELRKLECLVSYKTNLFGGRRGRKFSRKLVEVCP